MSKADLNKEYYESANGSFEKSSGDTEPKVVIEKEEEEEDDYEEIDDEEEDEDEDEDEDEGKGGRNTLTHLLIGNPNGVTAENAAKYEEDDEEDDEGDVDDDDEYVEDEDEDYSANSNPLNKKRSIDEVVDKPEEASQGSKKIKA